MTDEPRNETHDIDKILVAVSELIQAMRGQNVRMDRIEAQSEQNAHQIAGLIELAKTQIELTERNSQQIDELRQQGKEQQERINALIRIVEGHLSNHP